MAGAALIAFIVYSMGVGMIVERRYLAWMLGRVPAGPAAGAALAAAVPLGTSSRAFLLGLASYESGSRGLAVPTVTMILIAAPLVAINLPSRSRSFRPTRRALEGLGADATAAKTLARYGGVASLVGMLLAIVAWPMALDR